MISDDERRKMLPKRKVLRGTNFLMKQTSNLRKENVLSPREPREKIKTGLQHFLRSVEQIYYFGGDTRKHYMREPTPKS